MKLIDQDFLPIHKPDKDKTYPQHFFWLFDPTKKKFSLSKTDAWSMVTSPGYTVSIGNMNIDIPSNYYTLIGDFDGGIDFIKMDEVMGREFQAFTFNSNLEPDSWILKDLKILGYIKSMTFAYPQIKKPVAIQLGDDKALLVSNIDQYSKMKELSFGDII